MKSILLSPPEAGPAERDALLEALDSGWLAPAGPALDEFEAAMAATVGPAEARRGLSSGTAPSTWAPGHGVGPGDSVLGRSHFAAVRNAITYVGPLLS